MPMLCSLLIDGARAVVQGDQAGQPRQRGLDVERRILRSSSRRLHRAKRAFARNDPSATGAGLRPARPPQGFKVPGEAGSP